MKTATLSLWWLRIATLVLAALAAASATYWVLKWQATRPSNLSAAVVYSAPMPANPQLVARVLGGGQASVNAGATVASSAASHFKLSGVLANRANGSYALISVDGKPAKPYRVGTQVNEELVLHSVSARSASLATSVQAPVSVMLELPKLAPSQGPALPRPNSAPNQED
ncbi:MAG: general secretion pathway protein C [Gammaproteobacteria bacterium]|uniref:type II secretion system protein N n=1 Tax=Rhodoferax sp. TaxID=50421 RepID=UPI0017CF29D2|nr:type II secretion system protein N [Rhodoferax sp.]MBU3900479.1 general secretion pathway protein C [Gammaproteobacteria bacterium]MBA3059946.1 general secretion pathway protein C [Rhodoferax sp.]MBU3997117.1 general secretion pathway protein C [Gammaproteobacteria bacterium]MBU4079924.1 general secretion pathway protein C [Gammaproteobacteria bacterium]MBU4112939.1 general secretion pathway protein C [Gammaproteobacteria bacterium]